MKKNLLKNVGILAMSFLLANGSVNAQSPTAPAQGFNVFVKNGASFYTSETEGPVAIGGDLTIGGNYNVSSHGNFVYQVNKVNIGLLVAGKVNYSGGNSLQVLNNGYAIIGNQNGSVAWYTDQNNAASPIRITPSSNYNSSPIISLSASAPTLGVSATNNPVFQTSPINFASAFTTLQATATSLAACTDNAVIYNSPNQGSSPIAHSGISSNSQIYIKSLVSGTTTLNISGADFNNFQSLTFSGQTPDANHLLVINVNASGSYTWNAYTNGGISGTNAQYIIYNFYNTTSLSIAGNGAVEGTVFAPFADITKSNNNSNIEGQVIGNSYSQTAGGEIHSYNFTSSLTGCAVNNTPTTAASSLAFSNINVTAITASWTNGNGADRLVVVSKSPITTLPTNGQSYTANAAYGSGSALAGGYVVYNGSGSSVIVTGLASNTTYYFAVVEYNGSGSSISYGSYTSGSAATLLDSDGDGVADINDAYPNDATRAFNNYYPSTGYGTYLFEDNWPAMGDYDFNDMVVGYQYNTVTNAQNQAVELKAKLVLRAVGATYKSGFGIQLDNLSPSMVTGVTGTNAGTPSWLSTSSNGTEANQTYANVIAWDNALRLMPATASGFTNTIATDPFVTPDTLNLDISFVQNTLAQSAIVVNPYIIINQDRTRELHLADRVPTSKANIGYFGTSDDASVPSTGIYYVNKNNVPWALDIPATVSYPLERVNVTKAYLNLVNWAESAGTQYTNWYISSVSGNVNSSQMYNH